MAGMTKVPRWFATAEQQALFDLAGEIADRELAPRAAEAERAGLYPADVMALLGKSGLLGLPLPERWGGGGQPYEVYLQILERLAYRWFGIAESVHLQILASLGLARYGTDEQRDTWLPGLAEGAILGANCFSEPEAGSDLEAIRTTAKRTDQGGYVLNGTKSWVSHGNIAGIYNVYCRTGGPGMTGISCLLVTPDDPGVRPQPLEKKMAVSSMPTTQVVFDSVPVPEVRRLGRENRGMLVAATVFDRARLAIAACAIGLAQAALDYAADFARTRVQFGSPIISFQGVGFMLADMATHTAAARALMLDAARLCDAGRPFGTAAAQAKLFATDAAMSATTDAVQILGGQGYVTDHPVERWMREAKLLQIVEGTNQIQRVAIARSL
jgi:alkylation response protein AidB-like acyl-CoA dehydrogenase